MYLYQQYNLQQRMQVTKPDGVNDELTLVASSCGHLTHPSATAHTCSVQRDDCLHQAAHQTSADAKHTSRYALEIF